MAQPEKKFQAGACIASVFVNELGKEGAVKLKTVNLQRVYKDKDGNFQHTTSFGVNDVPKAALVLQKAYEYLALKDNGQKERSGQN